MYAGGVTDGVISPTLLTVPPFRRVLIRRGDEETTYVLHRWCWALHHPDDNDGLSEFIRAVCRHYILEHQKNTPETPRTVKRMKKTTSTPEVGPGGEEMVVNL